MLNTGFNVKIFAEALGMSHSALYKKIKVMTDKSVINFVNTYRIYRAVQIFNEGETNITTVATKCGFNDMKNFRGCFKERMGLPPKQYLDSL